MPRNDGRAVAVAVHQNTRAGVRWRTSNGSSSTSRVIAAKYDTIGVCRKPPMRCGMSDHTMPRSGSRRSRWANSSRSATQPATTPASATPATRSAGRCARVPSHADIASAASNGSRKAPTNSLSDSVPAAAIAPSSASSAMPARSRCAIARANSNAAKARMNGPEWTAGSSANR